MFGNVFERTSTIPMSDSCERTTVNVLIDIVGTACEHEPDLTLMGLVNLMDLYRTYLSHTVTANAENTAQLSTGNDQSAPFPKPRLVVNHRASFEEFIGDSRLLKLSADAASRESGIPVPIPAPLKTLANNGFTRTPCATKILPAPEQSLFCSTN